jgi:C1A family cysteine protease
MIILVFFFDKVDVQDDFMLYRSGIFEDSVCNNTPESLNHAVLLVGYGTDNTTGTDFWIVKNSWSTKWGGEYFNHIQ